MMNNRINNFPLTQARAFSSPMSGMTSTYNFVYVQQNLDEKPNITLRLRQQSHNFTLENATSLSDLASDIMNRFSGSGLRQIRFFAPDGAEISQQTTFKNLFEVPFFQMKIQMSNEQTEEFNILTQYNFSLSNVKYTLSPEQKPYYDECKQAGMTDKQAVEIARFTARLHQLLDMEGAQAKELTQKDLMIYVREALSQQASDIRTERSVLEEELRLLKQQLRPLEQIQQQCWRQGAVSAKKWTYGFVGAMLTQFSLTQYGTYVAFSWDIIEPITCCLSYSDTFLAFMFFVQTGRLWDIQGLTQYFQERKFSSTVKRQSLDMNKIGETKKAIEIIEKRLGELAC